MTPGLRRSIWLFPLVTTIHNAEEAAWLPAWSQQAGRFHPVVGAAEFRFAVTVLTLLAFLVTFFASRRGGSWLAVAGSYWIAMLLNVFFPHLLASIVERGYTPGVVTAVVLNLPVDLYLLRRALTEGELTTRRLVPAAAIFLPALVVAIPLLFQLGRALFR
jgi:hypothetical protein